MKKRILLDIDNTITTPDYIIQSMANLTGKEYTGEEVLETYRIGDVYGLTQEEDRMFWELFGEQCLRNSGANYQTIGSIYNNIIKENDYIAIITARDEMYRDITETWLKSNNVRYNDLIMVGDNSKIGFIESLDIDTVIDDKAELFEEIEVVKNIFPNSRIANKIRDGIFRRYVVQYPYNKDVKSEFIIKQDGKIIPNIIEEV